VGENVIVVLHHNWGPITTFQRSANRHAGFYLRSSWVQTDDSWRAITAPEFQASDRQIQGVIGDRRIRYPEVIDGRKMPKDIHNVRFDDSRWKHAAVVTDGPWPATPNDVETEGQQEFPVLPLTVLAAGDLFPTQPLSEDPFSIAAGVATARYSPNDRIKAANTISGHAGEARYLTFDFGQPVHGFPFLQIKSSTPGVFIDFGYQEVSYSQYSGKSFVKLDGSLDPNAVVGTGYGDRYITGEGPQYVEMPDERTARWWTLQIHFSVDGEITLKQAGFIRSQYPVTLLGSFHCGNERIDQIVRLCLTHALVSMSDAYVDTPGREDGQWIEDARLRAVLSARWFGDTALRSLLLRIVSESQGADGNFHPFPPSNFPAYPATYDWSMEWVAALHDDYLWSGGTAGIRQYWPNLIRYWKQVLSHLDEQGLWRTRAVLADLRVGVHVKNNEQSSGIVSAQLVPRLVWSAEMAEAIGETAQAAEWKRTAEQMTKACQQYHIVPANGDIPAHVDDVYDPVHPLEQRGFSQAAQTMAVLSDLLNPTEAHAALDYTFPAPDGTPPSQVTRWNNPTYAYRALTALSQVGFSSRAVEHLLERYSPYLPANPQNPVPLPLQGPNGGPLPEYFVSRADLNLSDGQINSAQPADETGSHGWASVPLLWLHESLLGVTITKPGGAHLRIAPNDGGLPYVSGNTVTPQGIVTVNWVPQTAVLEVKTPANVIADIVLPPALANAIRIKAPQACTLRGPAWYRCQTGGNYVFRAE
jgi:hypothetical protein